MPGMEHWMTRPAHLGPAHLGSTSSSSSSTQSGGSGNAGRLADSLAHTPLTPTSAIGHLSLKRKPALGVAENGGSLRRSCEFGSDMLWPPPLESDERHIGTIARNTQKYGNAERMETGDGVPVSSRVSAKIQQLVSTLKMPRRPPLREFFVDDFEELLEVQQPDPKQRRPEGAEMLAVRGEALGVVTNWPPSLEAALQRWGTISPKAPCLTSLDTTGKPLYVLTYGKLWSRSVKLAFNILHKLGSKQEPMVRPGDRVALVFPNNDPVAFMVAFYGCLLAEVVPVPIEVPLTRKDAGSQQIGFLLGSCGVTVALTSDACHKGLPKSATGEIPQFRGWPKLLWFVTESKHLSKPPRDWFPHIKDANSDTAYIEYKPVRMECAGSHGDEIALLTHCQALTQSCGYTEGTRRPIVECSRLKKDVGLWHGISTQVACVKVRDMHWALVAHREQKDISLSSLRMLLVADGSNPWSISSCDAFLNVFQSKGLRSEVICPCASSPEALTVAIRRPVEDSSQPPGRGVLSMQGLSYSVVRVDTEERLSVLTVQDVGTVMPGALVCVVKPDGVPLLCKTDEIGELCVCSVATGTSYYGLTGMTKNTFEVFPVASGGGLVSEYAFVRTGLLGFVVQVVWCLSPARWTALIVVSGRRHNADDIIATALAVEPMKFIYRGEIGPASVMVGNLVSGKRIAMASGRDLGQTDDNDQFLFLSEVLQWRSQTTPEHILYTLLSSRGSVGGERFSSQSPSHGVRKVRLSFRVLTVWFSKTPLLELLTVWFSKTPLLELPTLWFSKTQLLELLTVWFSKTQLLELLTVCKTQLLESMPVWFSKTQLLDILTVWFSKTRSRALTVWFSKTQLLELMTVLFSRQLLELRLCGSTQLLELLTVWFSKTQLLELMPVWFSNTQLLDILTVWFSKTQVLELLTVWFSKTQLLELMTVLFSKTASRAPDSVILPGVRIIIANPETKGPLGDSHLGEIWVHSAHNGSGYYSGYGEEVLQSDHFTSRLSFGDTSTVWARTGYLGFLRRTELTDASGERHDALYVVGALEEAMELRGMRYHPIDIETSVIRTHQSIMECAVFPWTNLLVVVIELEGSEQEALDLVPMVTKAVLEEHYLIVGVVVVTDIGVIPINSRGEKQRMHLRDGFLQDQLDPIYVAYNM
ncbi:disco-interacting protein 2 homolog C-like [Salvelinus sp. IW2-2015]|uniref:disco-interacting protein 2 homolog C-like n=1 Tax=Salvelinus sp. IW2-2015 TaxID=2691554 RepID=UPI0038D4EFA4